MSSERNRCSNIAPSFTLRIFARTKPRRLPGVTCCCSTTRHRSPLCLTRLPLRRRVAGTLAIGLSLGVGRGPLVWGGGDRLTERVYHRGPARYPRAMTAIRRWLVTGALVSTGFVGGALLTGRLQSRETEDAAQRPTAPAAAAQPAGAVAA